MRRSAKAYQTDEDDAELGALADAARAAANRAPASIDDVLDYVVASKARIIAMEAQAL